MEQKYNYEITVENVNENSNEAITLESIFPEMIKRHFSTNLYGYISRGAKCSITDNGKIFTQDFPIIKLSKISSCFTGFNEAESHYNIKYTPQVILIPQSSINMIKNS